MDLFLMGFKLLLQVCKFEYGEGGGAEFDI